ncbi:ParA family protein [Suttonella ornithocola]|uniref:Sporulation initiation inhibitor protein soj n=1 Tax=Suttonella ornithocola TaxID=279832 RepID=A0A380MW65_9GAMM|nr:ParA family protein [Suttonella ornithocola]SUO96830.1 Sporulation initiation inhibitor protein soj [Suttonella ornithocola]
MNAQTLALVSSKGGVGKSTVAINMACALGSLGLSVLCIDLDSQQSLSKFFDYPTAPTKGLLEFLIQGDLSAISQTHIKNVSVVVNNDDGERLNEWMSETFSGLFRLKKLLISIRDQYDVIIIDTQGKDGRGQLQEMALIAADTVVVPTTPDVMSSQELPRSIAIYTHVMNGLSEMGIGNDQPPPLRVLINREDHTVETRNVTAAIRQEFSKIARHITVLKTSIPQKVVWKQCISLQRPVHELEIDRSNPRSALSVMESLIHELLPHFADLQLNPNTEQKETIPLQGGQ